MIKRYEDGTIDIPTGQLLNVLVGRKSDGSEYKFEKYMVDMTGEVFHSGKTTLISKDNLIHLIQNGVEDFYVVGKDDNVRNWQGLYTNGIDLSSNMINWN